MSIVKTTLALLVVYWGVLHVVAKCKPCSGSGCGICVDRQCETNGGVCNFRGVTCRTQYYHDTCGGCSNNPGPWRTCDCNKGFTGERCEKCTSGYITDASQGCLECKNETHCSGHATAVRPNSTQTGCVCDCREGYAGPRCESCAVGYFRDPSTPAVCRRCSIERDCSNHADAVVTMSTGTCQCVCRGGFIGENCNRCADHRATYPSCRSKTHTATPALARSNVTSCVHGILVELETSSAGTGLSCRCHNQWTGPSCALCPSTAVPEGGGDGCVKCQPGYYGVQQESCAFRCDASSAMGRCLTAVQYSNINASQHVCRCVPPAATSGRRACQNMWEGDLCERCPPQFDIAADCTPCDASRLKGCSTTAVTANNNKCTCTQCLFPYDLAVGGECVCNTGKFASCAAPVKCAGVGRIPPACDLDRTRICFNQTYCIPACPFTPNPLERLSSAGGNDPAQCGQPHSHFTFGALQHQSPCRETWQGQYNGSVLVIDHHKMYQVWQTAIPCGNGAKCISVVKVKAGSTVVTVKRTHGLLVEVLGGDSGYLLPNEQRTYGNYPHSITMHRIHDDRILSYVPSGLSILVLWTSWYLNVVVAAPPSAIDTSRGIMGRFGPACSGQRRYILPDGTPVFFPQQMVPHYGEDVYQSPYPDGDDVGAVKYVPFHALEKESSSPAAKEESTSTSPATPNNSTSISLVTAVAPSTFPPAEGNFSIVDPSCRECVEATTTLSADDRVQVTRVCEVAKHSRVEVCECTTARDRHSLNSDIVNKEDPPPLCTNGTVRRENATHAWCAYCACAGNYTDIAWPYAASRDVQSQCYCKSKMGYPPQGPGSTSRDVTGSLLGAVAVLIACGVAVFAVWWWCCRRQPKQDSASGTQRQ